MKQLKAFFNKSICMIVTFLVMLDFLGVAESIPEHLKSFGVPMQSQFRLYTKAVLSRKNTFYNREMQYRRDHYHRKTQIKTKTLQSQDDIPKHKGEAMRLTKSIHNSKC